MSSHTIRFVQDFSPNPFGRYLDTDGTRSAEAFRTKHLVPALNAHRHVVVDLSGYNYYGSTFLEEAFGGLIREGFAPADLKDRLKVVHEQLPSIEEEATEYLQGEEACHIGKHFRLTS